MQNGEKDTIISISASTIVKALAILLGFWVLYILRDLILVILTAVILASSIEPAVKFLNKYRIHRIPAVLGVYVALVGLFIGLFYAFVPPLLGEVYDFVEKIPGVAQELSPSALSGETEVAKRGELLLAQFSEGAPISELLATFGNITRVSQGFTTTAGSIFGGLFSFVLIVVLSFYFAMQERGIENFLKIVIPFGKESYAIDLWERSKMKIGKWMQGQLLLGVLIFILVYLGLTIFGVPYALILALLAGVLEIIPVFGPILAAIPGVALAFGTGGTSLALIIAGFYLLVQQFESHLIYPLVVRKIVGVPPILVILALIIGAELAGFLGILISIPVAAAVMELVDDIEKKKRLAA
ncbi:MAG: AI-2E family transporter [Minisyncoccota bacterium]